MSGQTYKFEDPRVALKRHGFRPKHSWGQNFLVSQKAVQTIATCAVSDSTEPRRVIEIGAGVGTLTAALLAQHAHVIAIERDRDMCRVLRTDFDTHPAFELKEADAAKIDYAELIGDQQGVIAGNLPYQLTGKLLRAIIDISHHLKRAIIMVQEEVAARISAPPGHRSRGALSAIVQSRFEVSTLIRLKPSAFHPPPKVRSAVLCLTPHAQSLFETGMEPALFDKLVNAAFTSRRKTLKNSLRASRIVSSDEILPWLTRAGIDPVVRPERLTHQEFVRLLVTKRPSE